MGKQRGIRLGFGSRGVGIARRRGIATFAAALAAAGLAKVGTTRTAEAADNGPLLLGNSNTAQSATWISRDTAGDGAGTNCLIAISNDTNGNGFLGYGKGTGFAVGAFALGSGDGLLAGSSTGTAVFGETEGTGFDYGVRGKGGLFGVYGEAVGTTAAGVRGLASNNGGDGVQGIAQNGEGVYGFAGNGIGVYGDSVSGKGVYGASSSGVAIHGLSSSSHGVFGGSNTGTGVYGNGGQIGVYGTSTVNAIWGQTTNGNGVYGQATGTGIGVHGSAPPAGFAGYFEGKVYISGGIVTGPQAANASAVRLADGSLGRTYAPSMPESYVEDVGRAQLVKGQATVSLDADVAGVIADGTYDVTLTPYGDCKGLFVASRSAGGFTVGELQGGTGTLEFGYRVTAKQKGAAGKRLERIAGPGGDVSAALAATRNVTKEATEQPKPGAHAAPVIPPPDDPRSPLEMPPGVQGPTGPRRNPPIGAR